MENKQSDITVSICCLAYNHEPYIRQCLDGFMMQKTNFKFEVLIHDDASTDKTADIIREYEKKYPDIIKPIYQKVNQYSQGISPWKTYQIPRISGKYVAMCEGDDYWTDPYKLQKQVDFLESHPEYSMCFASAIQHWQDDNTKEDSLFSDIENRDYSGIEIYSKWIVPTATVMFKHSILDTDLYHKVISDPDILYGDSPLFITCTQLGRVYGMRDVVSVYRRSVLGTVLQKRNYEQNIKRINHALAIERNFGHEFHPMVRKDYLSHLANLYFRSLFSFSFSNAHKCFKKMLKYNLVYSLYYLIHECMIMILHLFKRFFK